MVLRSMTQFFACIILKQIKRNMKARTITIIRKMQLALIVSVMTVMAGNVNAQQMAAARSTRLSEGQPVRPPANHSASTDTIECLFHQVVSNNRPLLSWRKGFIILEDSQIRMGDKMYPSSEASSITGLIQNKFLASNKRKIVTKKVVQVVLLQ